MITIQETAKKYLSLFTRQEIREEKDEKPYAFYVFTNKALEVNKDTTETRMYQKLSSIMQKLEVGYDFCYYSTVHALQWISELEENIEENEGNTILGTLNELMTEHIDSLVFVYTGQLTAWLGENVNHIGFCDQALEEYGKPEDTVHLIMQGQYLAFEHVFNAILDFIVTETKEENKNV